MDASSSTPNNASMTPTGKVTQLHAAAVNGDRSTLARFINAYPRFVDAGEQFGRTPLMFCALADRVECAELLLKGGIHVDKRDKGGRTALHWAAHKGNFRLMKLLISKGANIRVKDHEGHTCLHLCTRHKSAKCISLLLKQLSPGEIDDQDNNKRTALHWASSYGNYEHVKMLIKQGSNIGIPDSEGKTPLHWAASSRCSDAVQCVYIILKTTPSVINWQDYEGRTALHLAVADGNEQVVDVLTSIDNCMVSALDNMFRTPLHWAAVLGHTKIVGLLLNRNADYCSSDGNGATPIHYAAQNNYADTVEAFLSRDTVTDEPDIDGRTAFIWAASKGADEVIDVFLKYDVDIHQVDNNGATALHAAALSGHPCTVKRLLDADALIDASDLSKHTPLLRACEMGHVDVVTNLIEAGARVDVVDQHAHTPLHWAALGGHAYICQILISHGVDPAVRDHSGRVPLQCAAYGGFVNCMSVLLEQGADPNTQDCDGITALHWACSRGHLDAVKLLAEYCAFPNHMQFTEDRYTPLDFALMGEHHEVAQYMIELGALSITAIQDIAAQKIQSTFRGYRLRKTFLGRKQLLMKHEQLKKAAAKKRATVVIDDRKKDPDIASTPLDLPMAFIDAAMENSVDYSQSHAIPIEIDCHTMENSAHDSHNEDISINTFVPAVDNYVYDPDSHFPHISHNNEENFTRMSDSQRQENSQSLNISDATFPIEQNLPSPLDDVDKNFADTQVSINDSDMSENFQRLHLSRTTNDLVIEHDLDSQNESFFIHINRELENKKNTNNSDSFETLEEVPSNGAIFQTESLGSEEIELDPISSNDLITDMYPTTQSHTTCENMVLPGHVVLRQSQEACRIAQLERRRLAEIRSKQHSALVIQRTWKRYKDRQSGLAVPLTAREAIQKKWRECSDEGWAKEMAALTIQLAWRKYCRNKLLSQLRATSGLHELQVWSPQLMSFKQQCLVRRIYGEEIDVPFWHPEQNCGHRRNWIKYSSTPALKSYNFAADCYHRAGSRTLSRVTRSHCGHTGVASRRTETLPHERDGSSRLPESIQIVKLPPEREVSQYSYNLRN